MKSLSARLEATLARQRSSTAAALAAINAMPVPPSTSGSFSRRPQPRASCVAAGLFVAGEEALRRVKGRRRDPDIGICDPLDETQYPSDSDGSGGKSGDLFGRGASTQAADRFVRRRVKLREAPLGVNRVQSFSHLRRSFL